MHAHALQAKANADAAGCTCDSTSPDAVPTVTAVTMACFQPCKDVNVHVLKESGILFHPGVFFLISSGSPHVLRAHMGV